MLYLLFIVWFYTVLYFTLFISYFLFLLYLRRVTAREARRGKFGGVWGARSAPEHKGFFGVPKPKGLCGVAAREARRGKFWGCLRRAKRHRGNPRVCLVCRTVSKAEKRFTLFRWNGWCVFRLRGGTNILWCRSERFLKVPSPICQKTSLPQKKKRGVQCMSERCKRRFSMYGPT